MARLTVIRSLYLFGTVDVVAKSDNANVKIVFPN